ncbi:protein containing Peptidyl-prolyl cis-trans isomerase, FKBP-type, partial [mine drainage metagenome]
DVDIKRVMQGLQDAYAKETPAVPVADMRAQLAGLQQRLRAQALANYKKVAANNLQQSEAFMAANKAKPGVITLPDGIEYRVLESG